MSFLRPKANTVAQPEPPNAIARPADLLTSMAMRRRRLGGRSSLGPVQTSSAAGGGEPMTNKTGVS